MTPDCWKKRSLGEIATESRERFTPNADEIQRYVGLEHIEPWSVTIEECGDTSEVTSAKTVFEAGDILFGKLRPYLRKVVLADQAGVCSTDILAIRPSNGVDARFLHSVLASDPAIGHAVKSSAGTKMPRTSWKAMSELEVLLPPFPEQRKIAEILSSVDDAIQATRAVIDQTRKVKQGLLQELLTKGIGHTRFKQTEIGEIPEEWEVAKCVDICAKVTDGEHLTPRCVESGMPLLSAKDVTEFGVEFGGCKYVSLEDSVKMLGRCNPEHGDVLIVSRGATIGRSCLNESPKPFVLMGSVILLKPNTDRVIGPYLAHYFDSTRAQSELLRLSGSSAQQAIYLKDIKSHLMPLPSLAEQERVSHALRTVESTLQAEMAQLSGLGSVTQGLMQDLLTGRVRVKVA